MIEYETGKFGSYYHANNGAEIWAFLTQAENVIRMETATYLSRPALEPLSPLLLERFGEAARVDHTKRMIGNMTRQIMEHHGYRLDQGSVKIRRPGNIFSTAARYAKA